MDHALRTYARDHTGERAVCTCGWRSPAGNVTEAFTAWSEHARVIHQLVPASGWAAQIGHSDESMSSLQVACWALRTTWTTRGTPEQSVVGMVAWQGSLVCADMLEGATLLEYRPA